MSAGWFVELPQMSTTKTIVCNGDACTRRNRVNGVMSCPTSGCVQLPHFSGFDRKGFQSLLAREWDSRSRCLFVAAPDIVGNARRTLELFDHWGPKLEGWPVALVIQNGQEDLPIPWELIDAVFIGGDDKFKTSAEAEAVIKTARAMGKWSHVGRVNTPERVEKVMEMGCDSIDGSGIAQYSHMRHRIASTLSSPKLFETSNT